MDPSRGTGPLGLVRDASVAFAPDGAVSYLGPAAEGPQDADQVVDGEGCVALPGLVDCHTHTVFGGSRADEYARRLAGETYVEVMEKGGGIASTVRATRAAPEEELLRVARTRLSRMLQRSGVTTVEIKSGYGLSVADETKMLRVARAAGQQPSDGPPRGPLPRTITTFLGAHTIPAEFKDDRDGYVKQVIEEQLPACAPLADHVDVFCDRGAFTLEESERILTAGREHGLLIKAHAEQIEFTGCTSLVARLGGLSADHVERLDQASVDAMAEADVVAVVLPGAQLYLKDTPPPVAALRAAGVTMAVATDFNPGSSPVHDLWTAASMSCVTQGLTTDEAVLGITRNAGKALGRPDIGWIGVDGATVADVAVFRPPPGEPAAVESMIQHMGGHDTVAVVMDGRVTFLGQPAPAF